MKPLILVPPAQAEALSDTQDDLHTQDELRTGEFSVRQPWRDDEAYDDLLSYAQLSEISASNAQLWPSSANSSR